MGDVVSCRRCVRLALKAGWCSAWFRGVALSSASNGERERSSVIFCGRQENLRSALGDTRKSQNHSKTTWWHDQPETFALFNHSNHWFLSLSQWRLTFAFFHRRRDKAVRSFVRWCGEQFLCSVEKIDQCVFISFFSSVNTYIYIYKWFTSISGPKSNSRTIWLRVAETIRRKPQKNY